MALKLDEAEHAIYPTPERPARARKFVRVCFKCTIVLTILHFFDLFL